MSCSWDGCCVIRIDNPVLQKILKPYSDEEYAFCYSGKYVKYAKKKKKMAFVFENPDAAFYCDYVPNNKGKITQCFIMNLENECDISELRKLIDEIKANKADIDANYVHVDYYKFAAKWPDDNYHYEGYTFDAEAGVDEYEEAILSADECPSLFDKFI